MWFVEHVPFSGQGYLVHILQNVFFKIQNVNQQMEIKQGSLLNTRSFGNKMNKVGGMTPTLPVSWSFICSRQTISFLHVLWHYLYHSPSCSFFPLCAFLLSLDYFSRNPSIACVSSLNTLLYGTLFASFPQFPVKITLVPFIKYLLSYPSKYQHRLTWYMIFYLFILFLTYWIMEFVFSQHPTLFD